MPSSCLPGRSPRRAAVLPLFLLSLFTVMAMTMAARPVTSTLSYHQQQQQHSHSFRTSTRTKTVMMILRGGGGGGASRGRTIGRKRLPGAQGGSISNEKITIQASSHPQRSPPPPMPSELPATGDGTATMTKLGVNLVKSILGAGVLSMSFGVAAFGDAPSALGPATAMIALLGLWSAFEFCTIGKVCAYTGATSYQQAWERTVGPETAWIPAGSAVLMTFLSCLAYSMILTDTFSTLLRSNAGNTILLGLTTCILLPLCWMKSLSALAPFSLLGIVGMGYTAIAMLLRCLDGSYATDGKLWVNLPASLRPSFGNAGWKSVFQPSSLMLLGMCSTAYMCHFNAPKFYLELKDNTLARYNKMVSLSFGAAMVLTAIVTALGFLTFGRSTDSLVLNNYAVNDVLMNGSRIAVATSLVFSYPLIFQGCRDGFLDVLQIQNRSNRTLNVATVAILAVITLLAATLKDVSFVLSFGGATLGNLLIYVYPCMMFVKMVQKFGIEGQGFPVLLSLASALVGIAMGIVGAKQTLDTI